MHTIAECPRCNKDFMYHQTDTYLRRPLTITDQDLISDDARDNWTDYEIICQDCYLKEKWLGKEVKTTNPHYLHLNDFKLVVDGIVLDEKLPITVKIGDTDSYEWFDEDELEEQFKNIQL